MQEIPVALLQFTWKPLLGNMTDRQSLINIQLIIGQIIGQPEKKNTAFHKSFSVGFSF